MKFVLKSKNLDSMSTNITNRSNSPIARSVYAMNLRDIYFYYFYKLNQ